MNDQLKRSLKSRHLTMIAMGGAIGTGLFFASGTAITAAGPGGALLAYVCMGIMVYFVMMSLGEMATFLPVSGSFETYANRFVDPAFGFALGWNYWFTYAITIAFELQVAAMIVKYWIPVGATGIWSQSVFWSAIFFCILLALNLISTRFFGEVEFWFAGIKVFTVIIFLIMGVLMIFGIIGDHTGGLSNWVLTDSSTGQSAPFVGGIVAAFGIFLVAGFSFMGTELVGITAGESENPEKNVPKAIKTLFWRILLFYVGAIFIVGTIVGFNDPFLTGTDSSNPATSPFTLVFERSGIGFAATLMNAVILTAVLSVGNAGVYGASRMLFSMAEKGKAPKLFTKVNKRGVPVPAVLATAAIAALCFFSSLFGDQKVYIALLNISALTGFIVWIGISLCHYRFRKAYIKQGRDLADLKFKAKFYPLGPILSLVLCMIVLFGANAWVFQGETLSWFDIITNYIVIPLFVAMYLIYKYVKKTKIVPLEECDFSREMKDN